VLRRLAWLALIPAFAAAGAHGQGPLPELMFTASLGAYRAACVDDHRLSGIGFASGSWSPDGNRVAIAGPNAIYVENADGSGLHPVTHPNVLNDGDHTPTWSPDGSTIAFSRYTGSRRSGTWIVDLATHAERQLTHEYARALAWSPTGDVIAADVWSQIALLRPDGSEVGRFAVSEWRQEFESGASWSPDASRLAVGGGQIVDRSGAVVGRYAPPSSDDAVTSSPSWSPDGSSIVFERYKTAYFSRANVRYGLPADLYTAPAVGGPMTRLTRTPHMWEGAPSFRPGAHADGAGTSQPCVIRGTPRRDLIRGTNGDDLIVAFGGNDVIDPGPGRDVVFAGEGNDTIRARDHTGDFVSGGRGVDTAFVDTKLDRVGSVERVSPAARVPRSGHPRHRASPSS
jgi:Tol biopolymer transport system component